MKTINMLQTLDQTSTSMTDPTISIHIKTRSSKVNVALVFKHSSKINRSSRLMDQKILIH